MFSPLAFPSGRIVYELTTHNPPASYAPLYPFELYRESLVIIAVADASELEHVSYEGRRGKHINGSRLSVSEHNLRELYQELEEVRDSYPKALVHQLFLFDHVRKQGSSNLPEGLVAVPPAAECKRTTLKTIMCDVSSLLLAEMTTLARSFQALSTIDFPGQNFRHANGILGSAWGIGERRSSQNSLAMERSRSESPAVDRGQVRMSMPAQFRTDSSSSLPGVRPSTPTNGVRHDSPTTFDDIIRPGSADFKGSLKAPPLSRSGTVDSVREASRDRISVQGFGSGSLSERARNKGKARVGVVIGSLYLCVGRWVDALRELSESATLAKVNLDHLWHAKALDNIIVSMLMLAWTGLDFHIPQICYASADKSSGTANDLKGPAPNRLVSLRNLAILMPELVDRILGLYSRSGNNTGEALPELAHCETVIRCSKLLSAVHLANGNINDNVLELLVLGIPFQNQPNVTIPRLIIRPNRVDIVTMVLRAFPYPSSDQLTPIDRIIILSGIAAVLGGLGYNRKKALVIRELLEILTPALIQARIKGAADMGVHPAAGLALAAANGNTNGAPALDLGEGDMENGVDAFLGLLTQIYGVVTSESSLTNKGNPDQAIDDPNEAIVARIVKNASIRLFGNQNMKLDVLRSCINLSEALPDFNGVLNFTVDLLRTAGSGVAPGLRHDASPAISREEQLKLATNITKTLNAARSLGAPHLAADYWDEFLVRGIDLEPLPASRTPVPHAKSELPGASATTTSKEVNPFIYNPFLRPPDAALVEHLLVAREAAIFRVNLQNPYEFELEIESVQLESDGAEFESAIQRTVIGPYRTQILTVAGTPMASGNLKITGCIVQIKGCRKRRFPIFVEAWSPQQDTKIKVIGLSVLSQDSTRPSSTASKQPTTPSMLPPKTSMVSFSVIDRQPVVVVESTTLAQSALMVLEGERQIFSITLQNLSKDTPVDLLLFSFKDSTQAPLQQAMSNRNASAAELYEYELIFSRKQALKWIQRDGERPYIKPGGNATFDIEILGKPGLTSAMIQMDYGHLGVPEPEIKDKFHTRQVSLPITITVNASIELARMDALPLHGSIPSSLWSPFLGKKSEPSLLKSDEYCLLLLDFRNTWPSHLQIHLEVADVGSIEEEILPGNTSRILVPVRRIFLEDPHASVPALDPSRQRQFVVSNGRISAETERVSRESFWYREALLKMLKGSWTTISGPPRHGDIELRGMRVSQRLIEVISVDEVGIDIIIGDAPLSEKYEIAADTFSSITTRITNRSKQPIHPFLRLQPTIRHRSVHSPLELSKKLAWNGVLQQALPMIPGGESTEITIGLTALCKGEFEIGASVEEMKTLDQEEEGEKKEGRKRTDTRNMMDAVLGPKGRRVWHIRQPCLLVVRDAESSGSEEEEE